MELDNLEKDIFISGMLGHYLYKRRNLVYLLFVEGNNLLFPLLDGFFCKNELKKEHNKSQEYKDYERNNDVWGHRNMQKIGTLDDLSI